MSSPTLPMPGTREAKHLDETMHEDLAQHDEDAFTEMVK
jgi:hypothetical protein